MDAKELVRLTFKIGLIISIAACLAATVWFVVRIIYLCRKKDMSLESAVINATETLIGFLNRLQQLPIEIQKAQAQKVCPGFQMYIHYYKVKLMCVLYKFGLL